MRTPVSSKFPLVGTLLLGDCFFFFFFFPNALEEKKNKLIGLVLSVGGAVVIVLGSGHHTPSKGALHVPKAYPIMGTSFLLIEVVAMAFFYILLPVLSRFYHSEWVTAWLFWAALPCYIFIFVLLLEIEPINSNQFIFDRLFFASLAYCAFQTVFYYNSIVFSSQHISGSMASPRCLLLRLRL